MTETDIDRLQTSMINMMEKLTTKMDLNNEELRVSVRSLFTAEAEVQRAAITEQFRVQGDRVTSLEATLAHLMVSVKAIQGEDEPHIMKMLEYENVQDIEPEEMMKRAIQEAERFVAFFKLPENKGKQDQFQKDMRHLHNIELWGGLEDFRDWVQSAVSWVSCVDLTVVAHTEVKSAL